MIELAAAAAAKSTSAWDQPGTLGFLVVFGMAVILYFVFRSMSRHLRKVNTEARAEALATEATEAGRPQADPLARSTSQQALAASDHERQQSEAGGAIADFEF